MSQTRAVRQAAALSHNTGSLDAHIAHTILPTRRGGDAIRSDSQLDAITFYHQTLAIPMRRHRQRKEVMQGEVLFHQAGCASCHRPQLATAPDARPKILAGRLIEPYTDMLLHDLGEAMSDDRQDYLAEGREWRTAPLWGIGLAEK